MNIAFENLKKHLQLAIRQLKEIKQEKWKFDVEEPIENVKLLIDTY